MTFLNLETYVWFYLIILTAFIGYELIRHVPVILHTPLMSGSNFIHGIVLVGAIIALGSAQNLVQEIIGFVGTVMATLNVTGGYVVTERMLKMFVRKGAEKP